MQRAKADFWVAVNKVDLGVHSCVSLKNSAAEVHTIHLTLPPTHTTTNVSCQYMVQT
jgi:hypothetical protein